MQLLKGTDNLKEDKVSLITEIPTGSSHRSLTMGRNKSPLMPNMAAVEKDM